MKRLISIILIFCNVTFLFAQNPFREIIYFKHGSGVYASKSNDKIPGQLISIKLRQKLNPETGFTSEVVFKPFENYVISPSVVGGTLNNGEYYIFDAKDIIKIESRYLVGGYVLKTLFSDKVQNEYSNRNEIIDILSKEYDEFHQKRQRNDEENPPNVFAGFFDFVFGGRNPSRQRAKALEASNQEIVFKKWGKFEGRLYSIRLNKKLNPKTGLKSEIVFKVFEASNSFPDEDLFLVKGREFVGKSKYEGHPVLTTMARLADSGNAYIFDPKDIRSIRQKNYGIGDALILYNRDFQNEIKDRQDVLDVLSHQSDVTVSQLKKNKGVNTLKTLWGVYVAGFCITLVVGLFSMTSTL